MSLPRRMAVTLPAGPQMKDTIERVQWAETRGFADAWFGDGGAPDALTTAAALGHVTKTIRVGVAVTPVYSRTPAVLAATANTLAQLLPGRFVMGLGSSSHAMVEGWHGVKFEKPIARVRETAIMVRSMLRGEKSSFDLTTLRSHGYRQMPLENPPPIFLAALRPKMIEMAAEVGDGVVFNLWPKRALPKMMEHVRIGAERAGKKPEDVEIVNRAMVFVTDDVADARNRFRMVFAPYYATPVYNRFLEWAGYPEAAETIREGFAARDRAKTSAALTDELIDEIAILGTAEHCRARLREDMDGGIHTQIIAPLAIDRAEAERTFDALTPADFPLG